MALTLATMTTATLSCLGADAGSAPLPPPVAAPVLPAEAGSAPPVPQPPADVRPPLPLPGETRTWQRDAIGDCAAPDETACGALPACAWVKIYGTVPGQPTAGFCHSRRALPAEAKP